MYRVILNLLLVLYGFSFARTSEKLPLPEELQAEELPWFAFEVKNGEGTYKEVINNGKLKNIVKRRNSERVVFAFFTTWCVPCREGLKLLGEKSAELKERKILVVLVNVGESDYVKVEKFIKRYTGEGWLLVFDKFGNLPRDFGLTVQNGEMPLPRTLILDSNLRPLILIGEEGKDYPQVLWK